MSNPTRRKRRLSHTRPTAREAAPLVLAVYSRPLGNSGCCWHVQLDDGNQSDGFWEAEDMARVEATGHAECIALGRVFMSLSQTQRRKATAIALSNFRYW